MLRKFLSIILCIVLVLSFVGCGQSASDPTDSAANDSSADSSSPADSTKETVDNATESNDSQTVQVDKNLLTVELTFPASYFGSADMSTFDTEAYIEEYGFISATVNEDGSLSVVMSYAKQQELLDEMALTLEDMIANYTTNEETAYIKEISHNDEFSSFVMKVDREAYENAFDATPVSIAISAAFYQMYAGIETNVEVTIIDIDTGETISSTAY